MGEEERSKLAAEEERTRQWVESRQRREQEALERATELEGKDKGKKKKPSVSCDSPTSTTSSGSGGSNGPAESPGSVVFLAKRWSLQERSSVRLTMRIRRIRM